MGKTIREEVFEVVRELPGCTSGEVIALMPHVKKQSVYSALDLMRSRGEIRQEKPTNGGHIRWFMNDTVTPPIPRRKRNKVRVTTTSDLPVPPLSQILKNQPTVDHLRARIAELEAWKAEAIQRYPDLAISPLLKRAREIVAEELLANGDKAQSERVQRGHCDNTLTMRIALKILEGETA